MRDLVAALGDELDEVRITEVKSNVFYAVLVFASGVEVEARPSDSIALALRTGTRIVCTEEVLEQSSIGVPDEEEAEVEKFREFLDEITPEDFEKDS
jgi:bifunctional DNase/RNase